MHSENVVNHLNISLCKPIAIYKITKFYAFCYKKKQLKHLQVEQKVFWPCTLHASFLNSLVSEASLITLFSKTKKCLLIGYCGIYEQKVVQVIRLKPNPVTRINVRSFVRFFINVVYRSLKCYLLCIYTAKYFIQISIVCLNWYRSPRLKGVVSLILE